MKPLALAARMCTGPVRQALGRFVFEKVDGEQEGCFPGILIILGGLRQRNPASGGVPGNRRLRPRLWPSASSPMQLAAAVKVSPPLCSVLTDDMPSWLPNITHQEYLTPLVRTMCGQAVRRKCSHYRQAGLENTGVGLTVLPAASQPVCSWTERARKGNTMS